ncbi:MAG: hypothetical protein GEV06_18955 [Luteitalea sp.]|nr:hypothetical protein [Luteitalea sp.]
MDRALLDGRYARLSRHQRDDAHRPSAASVALLADHPCEPVGVRPDEIQARANGRGRRPTSVGHQRGAPRDARRPIRVRYRPRDGRVACDGFPRGARLRGGHISQIRQDAANKLTRRLGWMTRAHPLVLDQTRLIVPLYSDGFSFSLMAISDDWGETWKTSTPLVGAGNIQPSIARRKDGTLVTYMRDNGPPPKRLMMSTSTDRGETWSPVVDSPFFNPGSGAEVITLSSGHWVLIYNDLERGRYSLAVSLSEDEGRTWPWTRHLERNRPKSENRDEWGEYHYPSIIEARDGTLHASYSYFQPAADSQRDAEERSIRKSIKHAHFNEAWIKQGDQ